MQHARLAALLYAAAALSAAEYSTFIGDQNPWIIPKLLVDASGNTYVAGSRTLNTSGNPLSPSLANEAVVVKIDQSGKTVFTAKLGGKGNDEVAALALDTAGNIYIAGSTTSPNYPVRNALDPLPPSGAGFLGNTKGFLTKLSPNGAEILYSTYFPSPISALAVDSAGAAYVAGRTFSREFPTTSGLPKGPVSTGVPIIGGAFLTKVAPAGDRIVYSTVLSGSAKPCGGGSSCFLSTRVTSPSTVAVDAAGNAYIAGNSEVTDLPTTPGVLIPAGAGAWIGKVNASGTALAYLTYLGAGYETLTPFFTPFTEVGAMVVDAAGNAFLTGSTIDPKLPFTNTLRSGAADAYALKLNPVGTALIWGRYFGGKASDAGAAATLDSSGNFWVAGTTRSSDFPNADGWSNGDDFVVRFDSAGETRYSARYPTQTAQAIGIDGAGLLHVASSSGVVSSVAASPRPLSRPWTVGPKGGQIAPGLIVEIYGPHIGGAGAQVFFNDIPAQILYAGDDQINAAVPFTLEGQKSARVRIGSGPEFLTAVLPAMPQIYGRGLNQDGSINSPENPARAGSIMTVWVGGTGSRDLIGSLYAEGKPVQAIYAGAAPGMLPGIGQINFVAPASPEIVLLVGNSISAPFPIYVR